MKKLNTLAVIAASLCASNLWSAQDMWEDFFEQMHREMQEAHEHMKQMWSNFGKFMEETRSQTPEFTKDALAHIPIDVNYDDPHNVIVTLQLSQDALQQIDAEIYEKRNITQVTVPHESGKITVTIDPYGMRFVHEQKIETTTKDKDDKESTQVRFSSKSLYNSFQVSVEAAKAQITTKGDTLIITLPREEKIKKLTIDRQ